MNKVTATSRNFIFTSKEEFHLELETENAHPIDVFNKLVIPELIEKIVIETNLFANQIIAETTMMRSCLKTWKDTSSEEIRTFLGLIMYMGLVIKPSIELY